MRLLMSGLILILTPGQELYNPPRQLAFSVLDQTPMSGGRDAALASAIAQGRTIWPAVDLDAGALASHLDEHGITAAVLEARPADLFLVAACARRDDAAIAAFEHTYLSQVRAYVARLDLTDEQIDEVRQSLRIKLLADRPPRITGYKGTGPLGAWVRVAAMRVALDLLGTASRTRGRSEEGMLAGQFAAEGLPEAELLRARYRPVLEAAAEKAIRSLGDREKAILRYHYVEGLNAEAIAVIYRVNRSSAARWMAEIRQQLLESVQKLLALEIRVSPSELRSLVAVVGEEMRLSVRRILGDAA
jgi:RNA polymerase sigma-70 factor (ECF subfamily)